MPHRKVSFFENWFKWYSILQMFYYVEVSLIKADWSKIYHIITLQELVEAAELACANLLDSVKYMSIINLPLSNVDDIFKHWVSSLSRNVKSYWVALNLKNEVLTNLSSQHFLLSNFCIYRKVTEKVLIIDDNGSNMHVSNIVKSLQCKELELRITVLNQESTTILVEALNRVRKVTLFDVTLEVEELCRMSGKLVNIFVWFLQDSWRSQTFFWSCRSFRMSGKLVNIFVWFVTNSWSAWRSQTFFWSCRSFRMSGKLVNIFVWFLTNFWSAWRSQTFFWSCWSFRMSGKLVNIFVSFLTNSWSAWRSQTFFWSCRSFRMSRKLLNIFVWFLTNSWSAWWCQTVFWSCRTSRMSGKLVNILYDF